MRDVCTCVWVCVTTPGQIACEGCVYIHVCVGVVVGVGVYVYVCVRAYSKKTISKNYSGNAPLNP